MSLSALAGKRRAITTHHTFAVRFLHEPGIGRHFFYHLLLSPPARERRRSFANGTTVLAIPRNAITELQFSLPPADLLERFERTAESLFARSQLADGQSDTLAALRDALLPKLISGEIRVPDAEEQVEAAV